MGCSTIITITSSSPQRPRGLSHHKHMEEKRYFEVRSLVDGNIIKQANDIGRGLKVIQQSVLEHKQKKNISKFHSLLHPVEATSAKADPKIE